MIVFSTFEELNWYLGKQEDGAILEIREAVLKDGTRVYEVRQC